MQTSTEYGQAAQAYCCFGHPSRLINLLHTYPGITVIVPCQGSPPLLAVDIANTQQCPAFDQLIPRHLCQLPGLVKALHCTFQRAEPPLDLAQSCRCFCQCNTVCDSFICSYGSFHDRAGIGELPPAHIDLCKYTVRIGRPQGVIQLSI